MYRRRACSGREHKRGDRLGKSRGGRRGRSLDERIVERHDRFGWIDDGFRFLIGFFIGLVGNFIGLIGLVGFFIGSIPGGLLGLGLRLRRRWRRPALVIRPRRKRRNCADREIDRQGGFDEAKAHLYMQ